MLVDMAREHRAIERRKLDRPRPKMLLGNLGWGQGDEGSSLECAKDLSAGAILGLAIGSKLSPELTEPFRDGYPTLSPRIGDNLLN